MKTQQLTINASVTYTLTGVPADWTSAQCEALAHELFSQVRTMDVDFQAVAKDADLPALDNQIYIVECETPEGLTVVTAPEPEPEPEPTPEPTPEPEPEAPVTMSFEQEGLDGWFIIKLSTGFRGRVHPTLKPEPHEIQALEDAGVIYSYAQYALQSALQSGWKK